MTSIHFGNLLAETGLLAEQELMAALGVCSGCSNKEIAVIAGRSPATIKKSLERVFYKLGIKSRSAVATELFCRGIVRKLVIVACAVLVSHTSLDDNQFLRIRRGGNGGERRIEQRVAARRVEQQMAV